MQLESKTLDNNHKQLFDRLFNINDKIQPPQQQQKIRTDHNPDDISEDQFSTQQAMMMMIHKCKYKVWEFIPQIKTAVESFVIKKNTPKLQWYKQLHISGQVHFENIQSIYIGPNTSIEHGVMIIGPAYIQNNVTIKKGAYIRGNVYIGEKSLIGNSVELKNCVIMGEGQIAHFNYIGDSILGRKAHFSAGAITSNYKLDGSIIKAKIGQTIEQTGLNKFGAIIGENVQIGCNAVLNPGSIICSNSVIYPLVNFRGFLGQNQIVKLIQQSAVVQKR